MLCCKLHPFIHGKSDHYVRPEKFSNVATGFASKSEKSHFLPLLKVPAFGVTEANEMVYSSKPEEKLLLLLNFSKLVLGCVCGSLELHYLRNIVV